MMNSMDLVSLHPNGIYQIRLPMGNPAWVNCYLIPDNGGYSVIDVGMHTETAVEMWRRASEQIGFTFEQIRSIVITHHHPDHYGLAGWLQQQSGAPVYVSSLAKRQIEGLWGENRWLVGSMLEMYRENGLPADVYAEMVQHWQGNGEQVKPHAQLTELNPGSSIVIGGEHYEVVDMPGHAAGHIGLYNKADRLLLCGDAIMPDSLPDTCFVPGGVDESPVESFLQTLKRMEAYEVELAFPGHYDPFSGFGKRLDELRELNAERQSRLLDQIRPEPVTAFEIYARSFPPAASILQLRFGFTETLSRLRWAQELKLVEPVRQDGVVLYRST
ncbi:MBL fold metallo-hydrolase [Paenibacillus thalictri]|nr:MBL fold metallo-hydrolase [Paenibacillus thalictri]